MDNEQILFGLAVDVGSVSLEVKKKERADLVYARLSSSDSYDVLKGTWNDIYRPSTGAVSDKMHLSTMRR